MSCLRGDVDVRNVNRSGGLWKLLLYRAVLWVRLINRKLRDPDRAFASQRIPKRMLDASGYLRALAYGFSGRSPFGLYFKHHQWQSFGLNLAKGIRLTPRATKCGSAGAPFGRIYRDLLDGSLRDSYRTCREPRFD